MERGPKLVSGKSFKFVHTKDGLALVLLEKELELSIELIVYQFLIKQNNQSSRWLLKCLAGITCALQVSTNAREPSKNELKTHF